MPLSRIFPQTHTSIRGLEGSHAIKELWARVDGPQLLQVRFVGTFEGSGNVTEEYEQGLTYSGSYTVWWKEEGADAQSE